MPDQTYSPRPVPALTVVLCTHDRPGFVPAALAALAAQELDAERFEVLLVDNASRDDVVGLAEALRPSLGRLRLRVLREEQLGLSHARNRGLAEAAAPLVAFIDDDARAAPDWCARIVAAFDTLRPAPAAVGGRILPWFEAPPPAWFEPALETRAWGAQAGYLSGSRARYGFSGSNMALPTALARELGGFSPSFGMRGTRLRLGEESQLFARLWERDPRFWYDPAIAVFHWVPARNLTARYRFARGFMAGRSNAAIDGGPRLAAAHLREWARFVALNLGANYGRIALGQRGPRRRAALVELQRTGHRLGYLLGRLLGPG